MVTQKRKFKNETGAAYTELIFKVVSPHMISDAQYEEIAGHLQKKVDEVLLPQKSENS